jgi:hypothetical protein
MKRWIIALELTALLQLPAAATELKPDVINAATFTEKLPSEDRINPLAVKVQVLLDRARFSPGEIDGRFGDNVEKALRAFAEANSLPSGKVLTPEIWSKLQQGSGDPVIVEYALTDQDVKGPFIDKLPSASGARQWDLSHLGRASWRRQKAAYRILRVFPTIVVVGRVRYRGAGFREPGRLRPGHPASILRANKR